MGNSNDFSLWPFSHANKLITHSLPAGNWRRQPAGTAIDNAKDGGHTIRQESIAGTPADMFFSFPAKLQPYKLAAFVFLFAWYGFLLVRPVDLTHGDLGRHLKNGEIILASVRAGESFRSLLDSNYYSYTFPDAPFVNHHWASGLFFYLVWLAGGFNALTIAGALLSSAAFLFFFLAGGRQAGFWPSAAAAFFLMPLIADRREVRPELFSYLFLGIVFSVLLAWHQARAKAWTLWTAAPLFGLWVNLHIYYIYGFALIGLFLAAAITERSREKIRAVSLYLAGALAGGLINPFGARMYLYPLQIMSHFGLPVNEMLPLHEAAAAGLDSARLKTFVISLVVFWLLYALNKIFAARGWPLVFFLIAAFFSATGWQMIRNLTMYGLIMLPLLAWALRDTAGSLARRLARPLRRREFAAGGLAVVVLTAALNWGRLPAAGQAWGVGLNNDGHREAALFLAQSNAAGPLFHDFDSGGYVIYYLFPQWRPFVDNRPEAYPEDFLRNTYRPIRQDEAVWETALKDYDFQTILLSFKKKTGPAIPFIVRRLDDPAWAPVFVDDSFIIFARRTPGQAALIGEYEIPRSRFDIREL
ncbi:MAG: Secreted protein [Candidatus Magasanikbacteria bacterium GW2011_GWA2_56_11]|uniref:Secreted protein n=1 Tax=Candidatus Magasanikbacteria bacterium GW2011_GWA2_56_11 TaxID=1619044 RepID=A0A0G2BAM0_9BACT|nr:MAG: Secreted protein [Candidatus Magasanikbacteria bacterium GW2011_GWA2_56_11]